MVSSQQYCVAVAVLLMRGILLNSLSAAQVQTSSLEWQIVAAARKHSDAMVRHFTIAFMMRRLSDPVSEKWLLEALNDAWAGTRMDAANALRFRSNPGMAEKLLAAYWRERAANDSHSFPSVRARMWLLEALARSEHPDAAEMVAAGMDDPAELVRMAATSRMWELAGKPGTADGLRKLLRSGNSQIQMVAMELLAGMQVTAAVSDIAMFLKHADARLQRTAASALCRLRNPAGLNLLREQAMKESDEKRARAMLEDLAVCGDVEARRTVLVWLSDKDESKRLFAISAARLAGLADAAYGLRAVAQLDPSPVARFQAAESLASITGRREPLLAMLKDADEWNRLTAARLLLEQGDLSGRPVLLSALGSPDPALRLEAARLAGRFLTQDEAWRLEDLLRDSVETVRLYAVQAAGQLRASELLPQLKAILEERRAGGHDLTAAAAEAIAAIGTGEAVSILREALKSEQFVTRLCAAVELIRMEQDRNRQAEKP
ncbi:MAG: hypothetical protein KatS3mg004_2830 [Bryobacteraceae bacterium]|nr:MAG: hypothetical protein KatS3mg004_2830 [Bryobacteraceae bacterium]